MSDPKSELAKLVARRKLEEGEFSYVLRVGGEPMDGKKAVYAKLKELQPEVFAKLKTACQTAGEDDQAFDIRMLRIIPQLPFEEENGHGGMDGEEKSGYDELAAEDLYRVVRVEGVDKKANKDEVESFFCREFEGVEKVKELGGGGKKFPGRGFGNGKWKGPRAGFDITFKDEKSATAFLAKEELKFKESTLTVQFLKDLIQYKVVRRQFSMAYGHNLRVTGCLPLEAGKEDNYIMVYGIGRPTEEEVQEYFVGLESEFESIVSAKTVLQCRPEQTNGKVLGVLVQDRKSVV